MHPELGDAVLSQAIQFADEAGPSLVWTRIFMLGCYAAAAGCLFRGLREGARTRWYRGVAQVGVFAFFGVSFWLIESWAHHRAPYHLYATAFADTIPRLPFGAGAPTARSAHSDAMARFLTPRDHRDACSALVRDLERKGAPDGRVSLDLPLSIVLMKASLAYSALWTARLMGASLLVQPVMGALVMVNIDVLLDPVLATSHECSTGARLPRAGTGLGLWRWYTDPEDAASWHAVPLFNYGAWFAAPVLLIAITNLVGRFFRDWLLPRTRRGRGRPEAAPAGWEVGLLVLIVVVTGSLFYLTPGGPSPAMQWIVMLTLLAGALVVVFRSFGRFEIDKTVEPTLTCPTAIALALPAVALFLEGFFIEMPTLIPVAIVSIGLGLVLVWLPYRGAVRSFLRTLLDVDRFVRLHYFSFTSMLVLLAAAMVCRDPDAFLMGGLLAVAASFHVYGYVSNDVIDLDLDRQQPRRQQDPLVRGAISRETALALALLQIPLTAVISFHLDVDAWAWIALASAFVLGFVYNRWGKLCPVPPLTDLVHGLAWAALALYGAFAANPSLGLRDIGRDLSPLLVYAAGFILLINGIHGGLRDLRTDVRYGKNTTARCLGAEPSLEREGQVESSRSVVGFAFTVHTAMFFPGFYYLSRNAASYQPAVYAVVWIVVALLFIASNVILFRVVKRREARRPYWVSVHLFVLLTPPMLLYLCSTVPREVFKVLALCCFLVPLALQVGVLERLLRLLPESEPASPAARAASAASAPGLSLPGPPPPP